MKSQYRSLSMNRRYENGGLYIIMSPMGGAHRYHWGIYMSVSDTYGMVYNATDGGNRWVMEEKMTESVVSSLNIKAALHFGAQPPPPEHEGWADAVHDVLINVPVIPDGGHDPNWGENFTCRVWVLEAIDRLRRAGLISSSPAREVEDDAWALAHSAISTARRLMDDSRGLYRYH